MALQAAMQMTVITDFDRLNKRLKRKERRVLSGTGAYTRGVLLKRISRSKQVSKPGGYPKSKISGSGRNGIRLILFNVRSERLDVIIGPAYFGSTVSKRTQVSRQGVRRIVQRSRKPVPQLLNEGGMAVRTTRYSGTGRSSTQRLRYRPRPYRELVRPIALKRFRELVRDVNL